MTSSISDFLTAVEKGDEPRNQCWFAQLDGDALEAMQQVSERIAAGERFTWSVLARALREHFDVKVSGQAIGRHFNCICRCSR